MQTALALCSKAFEKERTTLVSSMVYNYLALREKLESLGLLLIQGFIYMYIETFEH